MSDYTRGRFRHIYNSLRDKLRLSYLGGTIWTAKKKKKGPESSGFWLFGVLTLKLLKPRQTYKETAVCRLEVWYILSTSAK
jgi:hypothetical protein